MDPAPFSFLCWHLKTLVCRFLPSSQGTQRLLYLEAHVRKGKQRGSHLNLNPRWHDFYLDLLARAGLAQSVERQALNPTDLSLDPGRDSDLARFKGQIFQKGVQQDMKYKGFPGARPFKGPNLPKRGPTSSVRFPGAGFGAAGPLFGLSEDTRLSALRGFCTSCQERQTQRQLLGIRDGTIFTF